MKPDYECIQQYVTFYGEDKIKVLEDATNWIKNNPTEEEEIIMILKFDSLRCIYYLSFNYNFEHITFKEIKHLTKVGIKPV